MKLTIELREDQGGKEAKILVKEMTDIYQKSASVLSIESEVVD